MKVENYSSRKKEEKSWWEKTKQKAKLWTAIGLIITTLGSCSIGVYREANKPEKSTEIPQEQVQETGIYQEIKDSITSITGKTETPSYQETVEEMVPEMEKDDIHQFTEDIDTVYKNVETNTGVQKSIKNIIRDFDKLYKDTDKDMARALIGIRMIESTGRTNAVSHTGNFGIYQFGEATAKSYGLEITETKDERFNPEKSRETAERYLEDLHTRFGQWDLAILGYHQGEARVTRMVADYIEQEHGEEKLEKDIWAEEIEKYNIDLPDILENQEIVEKYMDTEYSLSGRNYVQKVFAAVDLFEKTLEKKGPKQ